MRLAVLKAESPEQMGTSWSPCQTQQGLLCPHLCGFFCLDCPWVLYQLIFILSPRPTTKPLGLLLFSFPRSPYLITFLEALLVISTATPHQYNLIFLGGLHLMWFEWNWPHPPLGASWRKSIHGSQAEQLFRQRHRAEWESQNLYRATRTFLFPRLDDTGRSCKVWNW